jgi:hypothetical protein
LNPNEQIVMAVGELANTLSRSPQFQTMITLFEQQVAHDLLTTKPDKADERERLYSQLQGQRAFTHHIAGLAEQYRAMTEQQAVDPIDLIDDPSVHDF